MPHLKNAQACSNTFFYKYRRTNPEKQLKTLSMTKQNKARIARTEFLKPFQKNYPKTILKN